MKKKGIGIVIEVEPKKKGKSMAKKEYMEEMKHKSGSKSGGKRCDYPEHEEMEKKHKKTKIPKTGEKKKKFENKVGKVMHEFKEGNLHPSKHNAPATHNRKQAIAIALSEAKRAVSGKKKKK